jgi:hypothetical protein
MCAKLKCCLNYEVDSYIEAGRKLPSKEVVLQTIDSDYYFFKSDILAGMVTYSTDKNMAANLEVISAERAKEIIEMNRRGEKPESLLEGGHAEAPKGPIDLASQESINRFDKAKKKKKKSPRKDAAPRSEDGGRKREHGPRKDEGSRRREHSSGRKNAAAKKPTAE